MPVDFVVLRASSIPGLVENDQSTLKAGITGSDIIWEAGWGKDAGEKLPIQEFDPKCKKSSLYIGMTKDFYNFEGSSNIKTLSKTIVATKYPNIAREVLTQEGVRNPRVFPVAGTDEAMQYVLNCDGILGIISSGRTIEANDIKVLKIFYDVTVRMIEASGKLSRRDREILDDIRERIAIAMQRKRMV